MAPGASRELVLLAVPSVRPLPAQKKGSNRFPAARQRERRAVAPNFRLCWSLGLLLSCWWRWLWGPGAKGKGPLGWLAQGTQLGGRSLSRGWKLSLLDLGASRMRAQANRPSPNEMQAHQ